MKDLREATHQEAFLVHGEAAYLVEHLAHELHQLVAVPA
jgi:hypothetical protein